MIFDEVINNSEKDELVSKKVILKKRKIANVNLGLRVVFQMVILFLGQEAFLIAVLLMSPISV